MAADLPTAGAWGRRTMRHDAWWLQPTLVVLILGSFVVYATYRVFSNNYFTYFVGGSPIYVSPFASPDLTAYMPALLVGLPDVGQLFRYPAFLILPVPAGFRFTCYYYRKSYYRSFVGMPPGCAVRGQTSPTYQGERRWFQFQNLHRYFLYLAIVVLLVLWYDTFVAFGLLRGRLYVGAGSFLFLANAVLLSGYTLGCHSFRHLIGGQLDCYSCDLPARLRYKFWSGATMLNQRHMLWAWLSLFSVAFTDVFVRLVASGMIHDLRLIG